MKIETLYKKHIEIPFPGFPDNPEFSNFVLELVEQDEYYSGLISSRSVSEVKVKAMRELDESIDKLEKFSSFKTDVEVYRKWMIHLASLKELIRQS